MKRDLSTIKELPGGWMNFEHLDPEAEKFTELLERYKLQVQNANSQVWVATLLPYDSDYSVVPEVKTPGAIKSLILNKLLPKKARLKLLAKYMVNDVSKVNAEQLEFQEEIEDGSIDGYFCAFTGPHVQNCLEKLLTNVKNDERYAHYGFYKGPGGCLVMGTASAYETDTMGQYLMNGKLKGSINEGQVLLTTVHPTLPEFSTKDPSFIEAYHKLVENMKETLTCEQLYESSH